MSDGITVDLASGDILGRPITPVVVAPERPQNDPRAIADALSIEDTAEGVNVDPRPSYASSEASAQEVSTND